MVLVDVYGDTAALSGHVCIQNWTFFRPQSPQFPAEEVLERGKKPEGLGWPCFVWMKARTWPGGDEIEPGEFLEFDRSGKNQQRLSKNGYEPSHHGSEGLV